MKSVLNTSVLNTSVLNTSVYKEETETFTPSDIDGAVWFDYTTTDEMITREDSDILYLTEHTDKSGTYTASQTTASYQPIVLDDGVRFLEKYMDLDSSPTAKQIYVILKNVVYDAYQPGLFGGSGYDSISLNDGSTISINCASTFAVSLNGSELSDYAYSHTFDGYYPFPDNDTSDIIRMVFPSELTCLESIAHFNYKGEYTLKHIVIIDRDLTADEISKMQTWAEGER